MHLHLAIQNYKHKEPSPKIEDVIKAIGDGVFDRQQGAEIVKAVYATMTYPFKTPLHEIEKVVCKYLEIDPEKLHEKTRKRPVVYARQCCMYLMRKSGYGQRAIGDYFGGFDHTTVFHSCQTVENIMEVDTQLKRHIYDMQHLISIL